RISHYPSMIDLSQFLGYDRHEKSRIINLNDYEEFNVAYGHLINLPQITAYYKLDHGVTKVTEEFLGFLCENMIEKIIERYYYLHGDRFNEQDFVKIYLPIEKYIYAEDIWFNISVPILFLKFDTDHFELTDRIIIRRISDEVNRA